MKTMFGNFNFCCFCKRDVECIPGIEILFGKIVRTNKYCSSCKNPIFLFPLTEFTLTQEFSQ